MRLLRDENLATNILDIADRYREYNYVCGYDTDGVLVMRCPPWEDDPRLCCEAHGHFERRVEIGELQIVSRYAKLFQDPKYAVASCATLPWKLVYTEKYAH